MEISPAFVGFLLWNHEHHILDKTPEKTTLLPRANTQQADPEKVVERWGSVSSHGKQARGQEVMTSICTRGGLGWIF